MVKANLSTTVTEIKQEDELDIPTEEVLAAEPHQDVPETSKPTTEALHLKLGFFCDVCKSGFSHKAYLAKHKKRLHVKVEVFRKTCKICGRIVRDLPDHIRTTHPSPEEAVKCPLCSRVFKTKRILSKHHKNVHIPPKYKCHICSIFFKMQHHLNRHMRIHAKELFYNCELCNFKTNYKDQFTAHKKKSHELEYLKEQREVLLQKYDPAFLKSNPLLS